MTASTQLRPAVVATRRGIGTNDVRPDGMAKATGAFAYSSDLREDGMLWGATVRSPHASAKIISIDLTGALATPGVAAVLTQEDVPGQNCFGLETPDQPVLAAEVVRYVGEAVALVAAEDPETARRAAEKVQVEYEVLIPLVDAEAALDNRTPPIHPDGNVIRHLKIRRGDPDPVAEIVVRGVYEVGMQDQAFLGPESCLAIPEDDGGLRLYCSTQWLHIDQSQLSRCLGLSKDKLRLTLSGVGGAFGGKEDLSVQAHACMLALATGRTVKMSYGREESFSGHVHRHPARMEYEHGADRHGRLVYVRARIVLDGGAYASTSAAVVGNAGCFAVGPYEAPAVHVDCFSTRTNNPPCGAMRGFGALQVTFAYEAQMDKLADELGIGRVEVRLLNALETGSTMPTGQTVEGPAPVRELLQRVEAMPLPEEAVPGEYWSLPGGLSNTTRGEGVRRGIGYAVSIKSICKSAGYDDFGTARVTLRALDGAAVVEVHTAAAEVGQGLVTVQAQIARTELTVQHVVVKLADTDVGDAGTSSASRQTWISGGAVQAACRKIRDEVLDRAAVMLSVDAASLALADGEVVAPEEGDRIAIATVLGNDVLENTSVFRHRTTSPLDPETGQGDAHVAYAFAAHRAVVDVDVDLGLVHVVEVACAQDVGKAMNPQAIEGQMQGAIAQGVGLALMEELIVSEGVIQNPSFTDYLIPTILDMPTTRLDIVEHPRPDSPYGLTGVGEPPLLSTPSAIVSAIADACGVDIDRIPVRPETLSERCLESR